MTFENEVAEHRKKINRLNADIIKMISERVEVAKEIGIVKRRYGKPVVDKQRERAVLDQVRVLAMEMHLDPDGVERIFTEIIRLCVKAEEALT